MFSQLTLLLMYLSLETVPTIRTGLGIPVELIDQVNSVIFCMSQAVLLRLVTFLLGSLTVYLIALFFRIYFYLLNVVFVLQ